MASGHQSVFASSKEKTVSYKQLKHDFAKILKEHGELQNKHSKQKSQLHNANATKKRLDKENRELKEQLNREDKIHKDAVADISETLGRMNDSLQKKVEAFERELEKLGINPATFEKLPGEDLEDKKCEIKSKVDNLITNLNSSVAKNETLIDQFQAIMDQCKLLHQETDGATELVA